MRREPVEDVDTMEPAEAVEAPAEEDEPEGRVRLSGTSDAPVDSSEDTSNEPLFETRPPKKRPSAPTTGDKLGNDSAGWKARGNASGRLSRQ